MVLSRQLDFQTRLKDNIAMEMKKWLITLFVFCRLFLWLESFLLLHIPCQISKCTHASLSLTDGAIKRALVQHGSMHRSTAFTDPTVVNRL